MNINKLIKEAHENAVDKGFWECKECAGSGTLRYHDYKEDYEETRDCYKCRGTGKHGDIIRSLALINSELYEALEAHRKDDFSPKDLDTGPYFRCINDKDVLVQKEAAELFENAFKDTFEDEIADVLIRIFDIMGYLGYEYIKCNSWVLSNSLIKNIVIINKVVNILFGFVDIGYEDREEKSVIDMFNFLIATVLSFGKQQNIDIEKHIDLKMAYNKTRLRKHGKRY